MYHIKKDKRAIKSAKIITDSVMEILKVKSFDDLTITDIEKKCFVARSTFYRLFDNTVDVLAYKCDLIFGELITMHHENEYKSVDEIMILAGEYWMKNSQILEILYKSGHQNILQEAFERNFDRIRACFPVSQEGEINPYVSAVITSLISTGLIKWVELGKKGTPEELWTELREAYRSIQFLMK